MHKTLLFTAALALTLASCAKERPDGTPADGQAFRIVPAINSFLQPQEPPQASTRAIVEGTTFANGNEVGYIILGSAGAAKNSGVPHLGGYGNVRAQAIGTGLWMYFINKTQYVGGTLTGFPSYGNVDIYGYYPYDESIDENKLHAIPYSLGTVVSNAVSTTGAMVEKDYMYAAPQTGYMMSTGSSAHMVFNHVMTCLEFRIRKMFAGPDLVLKTIKFTIDSGRTFDISGTFDTANGSVIRSETASEITVDYSRTLANNTTAYMSCALILPGLDCTGTGGDATITAVFHFTDQDGGEWVFRDGANTTYSFKLSEVVDPVNSADLGLRAGKRYQVAVEISNFVKYNGMPTVVYPDWNVEDSDPNII